MKTTALAAIAIGLLAGACVSPQGSTVAERHASAVEIRENALEQLYERNPEAKKVVESSPGYAFFSGGSFHPGLFTFASGWAIVRNNETNEETYQKFWRLGLGPGLAIKGNYGVIVAEDAKGIEEFRDGGSLNAFIAEASFRFWGVGGSAVGASDPSGVAGSYVWTHTGFALEAMWLYASHSRKDEL